MEKDYINTSILDGQLTRMIALKHRKSIRKMKVMFGLQIQEMISEEWGRFKTQRAMKLYWRFIAKI